jgi:hypothetical protein
VITQQYLKECFTYDEASGKLYWRFDRPKSHFKSERYWKTYLKRYAGNEFGRVNSYGYRAGTLLGGNHKSHRLIYLLKTGSLPLGQIDHINGTKDDNRWVNLEDVSSRENLSRAVNVLSDCKVREICKYLSKSSSISYREIGRRAGCCHASVSDIYNRRTFIDITVDFTFKTRL